MAIIIIALSFVAVICCVMGIMLILNGIKNAPDVDRLVPVDELDKVKSELDLKEMEEHKLKSQLDAITIELEQTRENLNSSGASEEETKELQEREHQIKIQVQELERKLSFIKQKANIQAEESIQVINSLHEKNRLLLEKAQEKVETIDPQELDTLRQEKLSLQAQLDTNLGKIKDLEDEKNLLQTKVEETGAQEEERIQSLTEQNEKFKSGVKQITQKIAELDGVLDEFKRTNEEKLKEAQETVARLETQVKPLEEDITEHDQKIETLEKQLREKEREYEERLAEQSVSGPSAGMTVAVPDTAWVEEKKALEDDLGKMRSVTTRLKEKEKALMFELTKSRAHALGLEKLCEGLQSQLEGNS